MYSKIQFELNNVELFLKQLQDLTSKGKKTIQPTGRTVHFLWVGEVGKSLSSFSELFQTASG